jgi:single-strand DNA-binding protein
MPQISSTTVTMVGNLASEPDIRTVGPGVQVANFRLAASDRRFDQETGQWVDTNAVFLKVSCWRTMAHNVIASLRKGDPVVVFGRLQSYSYVRDDQQRTSFELDAYAIGPNLARGFAVFHRSSRPQLVREGDQMVERPSDAVAELPMAEPETPDTAAAA